MDTETNRDEFEYTSIGRPPGLRIEWRDGRLTYGARHAQWRTSRPTREAIPTPSDWETFWKVLDLLHVWEWEPAYVVKNVLDGYHWGVKIAKNGRRVESHGSHVEPPGYATLSRLFRRLADGTLSQEAASLAADAASAGRAFESPGLGVEALIEKLRVGRGGIEEEQAVRALGRLGWPSLAALPELLRVARFRSPRRGVLGFVALYAIESIARSARAADPGVVAPLVEPVLPDLLETAWSEGEVLVEVVAKLAPEHLVDFLRHPSPETIGRAAKALLALGIVPPEEGFDSLLEALRKTAADGTSYQTGGLVRALSLLYAGRGEDRAAALLMPLLFGNDERAQERAARGLSAAGRHATTAAEALLPRLSGPDPQNRKSAVELLGWFGPHVPAAAAALPGSAATDPEPENRKRTLEIVQFWEPSSDVRAQLADAIVGIVLHDPIREVRIAATEALDCLEAASAVPALFAAISDTGLDLRTRAAIGRILLHLDPDREMRVAGELAAIVGAPEPADPAEAEDCDEGRLDAVDLLGDFEGRLPPRAASLLAAAAASGPESIRQTAADLLSAGPRPERPLG